MQVLLAIDLAKHLVFLFLYVIVPTYWLHKIMHKQKHKWEYSKHDSAQVATTIFFLHFHLEIDEQVG